MQRILYLGDRPLEQLVDGRYLSHFQPQLREYLLRVVRFSKEPPVYDGHYALIQECKPRDRKRSRGHRDYYVGALAQAIDGYQPVPGQQETQHPKHNQRLDNNEPSGYQQVAHPAPKNQSDGNYLMT